MAPRGEKLLDRLAQRDREDRIAMYEAEKGEKTSTPPPAPKPAPPKAPAGTPPAEKEVPPGVDGNEKAKIDIEEESRNSRARTRVIAQRILDAATETLQRKEPAKFGGLGGWARAQAHILETDHDAREAYAVLKRASAEVDMRATARRGPMD
jgi:hypothetical protein